MFCTLNREADVAQLFSDFILQLVTLLKEIAQFRCQPLHLVLKRFSIVFLLGYANIASGREDEVLRTDVVDGTHGAEALLVLKRTTAELLESVCDTGDVLLLQLTHSAGHHCSHLTCIDEERLAWLLLVACQEP